MDRRVPILLALSLVAVLSLVSLPAGAAPPPMSRDDIVCRANSGVGFSYYWGGGCWCANGCTKSASCAAGSCWGNCPNCGHSGTYGADCSGFVTKVWQVPSAIDPKSCGHGPYVAKSYTTSSSYWSVISRSSLQKGDALASSTHVLIYEKGDPWGYLVAYEARGCSYGIAHNTRTCGSNYVASRRVNLTGGCECSPGQKQTDGCGNCGSRTRTCGSSCKWGGWSSCQGQGSCSPGSKQEAACGDCGEKIRTCKSSCEWGGWSSCKGQGCSPGETQTEACGNCGTRTRTCNGSCGWSGWSGCQGEGPCAPGTTDTQACCDCGQQTRACNGSCQWDGWSGCAGPDPLGACDTGELGPCAPGTVRCVDGCKACVRNYDPVPELCDAFDNDCTGVDDDGNPTVMGDPPPPYAARLMDMSFPRHLGAGEVGRAWASFLNEGQATWQPGEIWLASLPATELQQSSLYDAESWPAWDVAAVLDSTVLPGERGTLSWSVRAPKERGAVIREPFRLEDPQGALMRCPGPEIELEVRVGAEGTSDDAADERPSPTGPSSSCSASAGSRSHPAWLGLLALGLVAWRRGPTQRRRGVPAR